MTEPMSDERLAEIRARVELLAEVDRLRAMVDARDVRIGSALGIIERASDHLSDRGTHDASWGRSILQGVAAALKGWSS